MDKEGKRDFDAAAAGWDEDPRRVQLAQDVAAAICREVPLAADMEALDYGCGSGLVTLGLQPFVRRITGADSSRGMLEVLNQKLRARGIANVDTRHVDLEQQEQLAGRYDLIVSSMTMHHVRDVGALVASLVDSLKPGGRLALADLASEDGFFHDDPTGVQHHGFDRDFLSSLLSARGLVEVRTVLAATVLKSDGSGGRRAYPVLLWLARKGDK